ncbi:hypothetical protein RB195_008267 [Necator americanus]|uniref:Uncharacterized protein n=1 Tax=Necator americanus TaxID=51031 RepID=A0ABR1CQF7_NECAM
MIRTALQVQKYFTCYCKSYNRMDEDASNFLMLPGCTRSVASWLLRSRWNFARLSCPSVASEAPASFACTSSTVPLAAASGYRCAAWKLSNPSVAFLTRHSDKKFS